MAKETSVAVKAEEQNLRQKQTLRLETIEKVLEKGDSWPNMIAAAKACRGMEIPEAQLKKWRESIFSCYRLAALYAKPTYDGIIRILTDSEIPTYERRTNCVPWEGAISEDFRLKPEDFGLIHEIPHCSTDYMVAVTKLYKGSKMSIRKIREWMNEGYWQLQMAALYAAQGRENVPIGILYEGLESWDDEVAAAAAEAFRARDFSMRTLRRFLHRQFEECDEQIVRNITMVCEGKPEALPLIREILDYYDGTSFYVHDGATEACEGMEIPLEVIKEWAQPFKGPSFRRAAACASIGRNDVPKEIIEELMGSAQPRAVRSQAYRAAQLRDDFGPIRTIRSMPVIVYKKCLGGVIVAATIPEDAEIRHSASGKCRANKAEIVEIYGSFYGEKVGISMYDLKTQYRVGDKIEIPDFDGSLEECSTGFHFYCKRSLAEQCAF